MEQGPFARKSSRALSRRDFIKATAAITGGAVFARSLPAAQADLLRSAYVQNVNSNRASILWTMRSQVAGSVTVGSDPATAQTFTATVKQLDPAQTGLADTLFQYEAKLTGLSPNTTYPYQFLADGRPLAPASAGPLTFQTADTGAFSFITFGDSGSGDDIQMQLGQQMAQEPNISLVLANGDLAYPNGTIDELDALYFTVYRDQMARVPFFGSLGNHEYTVADAAAYLSVNSLPTETVVPADQGRYYSFDWNNVHFVCLDSNRCLTDAATGSGAMLKWLANDLAATRKFWRIVYYHHPTYATGIHSQEPEAVRARQYIAPLMEKYGVQLVLNAHEHSYQRSFPIRGGQPLDPNGDGVVYITSGGGGGGLYANDPSPILAFSMVINHYLRADVTDTSIQLTTTEVGDGKQIDGLLIAPPPRIDGPPMNTASFTPSLGSGGLFTLFGRNLCTTEIRPNGPGGMMVASGTSVALNGNPVPMLYAGPNQINGQIPGDFTGHGLLMVKTVNGTVQTQVQVAQYAPAIFTGPDGFAVAVHEDGTLVTTASPAKIGEVIALWFTGLGGGPGMPAPDLSVRVGTVAVTPISINPAPFQMGVYEVRVQMPKVAHGGIDVWAIANGIYSNTSLLASG